MRSRPIPKVARPIGGLPLVLFLLLAVISAVTSAEVPTSEGLESVNGTELWVTRMGSGEPIVVVHGGPVLEHGYLLPSLAPLAEQYELIFFDQRLSGRSAPSVEEGSVRMDAFVEDIEALRVELGLGKIHLMGHSWGGQLAMRYAIEYEQNLSSLIVISSMAASAKLWKEEERLVAESVSEEIQAKRLAILESEEIKAREPAAIERLMRVSFASQFHDPAQAEGLDFYVPDDYGDRSTQFAALAPELESYDLHEALRTLSMPALVLYGESEPGAELGGAAIAEALSGSELVLIPEAGHFPFLEQPEAFLRTVSSFLEGQQGADAGTAGGELSGNRWELTQLGDEPLMAVAEGGEPHLVFDSAEKNASGTGGCNRLNASYELDGAALSFGPVMATRMSCGSADAIEMALFSALGKSQGWRLEGDHLELLDGDGAVLARFQAAELE